MAEYTPKVGELEEQLSKMPYGWKGQVIPQNGSDIAKQCIVTVPIEENDAIFTIGNTGEMKFSLDLVTKTLSIKYNAEDLGYLEIDGGARIVGGEVVEAGESHKPDSPGYSGEPFVKRYMLDVATTYRDILVPDHMKEKLKSLPEIIKKAIGEENFGRIGKALAENPNAQIERKTNIGTPWRRYTPPLE